MNQGMEDSNKPEYYSVKQGGDYNIELNELKGQMQEQLLPRRVYLESSNNILSMRRNT